MITKIELSYKEKGIGKILSNLYPHPFTLDDMKFASIEGFLQSIKFEDLEIAELVRGLYGMEAFKFGQNGNDWKQTQTLWYNGSPINRHSKEYAHILTKAYDSCFEQNDLFRNSLLETGADIFTHYIGKYDQSDTTLTITEYLYHMYRLRSLAFQRAI